MAWLPYLLHTKNRGPRPVVFDHSLHTGHPGDRGLRRLGLGRVYSGRLASTEPSGSVSTRCGAIATENRSKLEFSDEEPMNWADRISLGIRRRIFRNLTICLFVTVGVASYILVTDAWQASQNYCAPHYGTPSFGDIPWRGPGGYCTPQIVPSLILLSIMTVVLYLPVSVGLLAVVAIVLSIFSTPHDRASRLSSRHAKSPTSDDLPPG